MNDFLKIYENGTHGAADWKYFGNTVTGYAIDYDQADNMMLFEVDFFDLDGSVYFELLNEVTGIVEYATNHDGWTKRDEFEYMYNWINNKAQTGIFKYYDMYKYAALSSNEMVYENPAGTMARWVSVGEENYPFYITRFVLDYNHTFEHPGFVHSRAKSDHYFTGVGYDDYVFNDIRIYDTTSEAETYLFGDQDPEIVDPQEPEDYEDTPITSSDAYNSLISNFLTNFTVIAEMDKTNLNIIAEALNNNITADDTIPEAVMKIVRSIVQRNISDGILSIKIVPIPPGSNLPYKSGISEKLFKPLGLSNVNGKLLNNTIKKYQIGSMRVHPIYKDYRDYMCEYSIYLPFSGIHKLDADIIVGNILNIYADIDFLTGSVMYHLIINDGATSRDIYTFTGECAVELPITGADYSAKYQTIMNGVFSGVGMIAGAAAGGPIGAAAGAMMAATGLKTLGNAASVKGQYLQSGKLIPNSSVLSVLYPYLIISKPQDVSPDYKSVKGKPTHKMLGLNSLSGFSIISNINLDSIAYATDEDKEALRSLLANGVYF